MANIIGVLRLIEPPHIVAIQLKIFTPVGTPIRIVDMPNAEFATVPSPVVYMWCTQTPQLMNPMAIPREHDERIAEQRLARERGQDLGDDAHRRQDEDVHLRMAEQPEHVLPEQRVAARVRVEEVRVEQPVEHQLEQRRRR